MSYLTLGKDDLSHTKIKQIPKNFNQVSLFPVKIDNELPIKHRTTSKLKKRILAYSAKKKRAKAIPLYSTLNPLTSSDSLSAKSKGALFVSATPVTINKKATGNKGPNKDPL